MFASHKFFFRSLCWLMAIVTPLSPTTALLAQTTAGAKPTNSTRYVLPYSAAIVSARPRQLLTCDAAEMMPIEVVQAACLKELGFDPLLVERIVFSMIPPLASPPSYAFVVECTEQVELSKLSPKLTEHTVAANHDGKAYLQSQNPQLPSLIWVDGTTLLVAPEHSLNQLLTSTRSEPDSFAKQLEACHNDDLALLINMALLRPFIQIGVNQAATEIPPEFQEFLEIPSLLDEARLRVNFSGSGPLELSLAATDDGAANRVEQLIERAMSLYREQASQKATELLQSEDPVEKAMGRYITRVTPIWTKQFVPARDGERFTLFELPAGGNMLGGTTGVAVVGVLVALLLPAVQAAREAARRVTSMNYMKQILLAFHNYHDAKKRLPAYANFSPDGKPLLSWRVHILPYLEQQELYKQFHLDEPWDSEHNRQLIPQMPEIFIDPSSPRFTTENGHTHYLAVRGKGMAFDGSEGIQFREFTDGLSNSIVIVQCNDEIAVPWTKPEDFKANDAAPLEGLANGFHPGHFMAGFADGHVLNISDDIDPEVFQKLLTIAGGEVVNLD